MRSYLDLGLALAVLALFTAAPAFAQTTTTTTTITTTTYEPEHPSQWVASGFVGSSFGVSAQSATADFGGTLSYLHHGAVGVEFLAGFAPELKINRVGGLNSDVNNYMGNIIAAVPIGFLSTVHPYVSGGLGVMTLSLNTNSALGISRSGNPVLF